MKFHLLRYFFWHFQILVTTQKIRLTTERNKLKRKYEIGINVRGKFYPPDSLECQSILNNISNLHNMMLREMKKHRRVFQQGPIAEKALVHASLYQTAKNEIQLNILDISFDDNIELAWKRQLNKLYLKEYLKQSKV